MPDVEKHTYLPKGFVCLWCSLMPQPWTHCLMFESYPLLTAGVNVKTSISGNGGRRYAFKRQCLYLCFALAHSEESTAYARHAWCGPALRLGHWRGTHAPMARRHASRNGEKGRQAKAPRSTRQSAGFVARASAVVVRIEALYIRAVSHHHLAGYLSPA